MRPLPSPVLTRVSDCTVLMMKHAAPKRYQDPATVAVVTTQPACSHEGSKADPSQEGFPALTASVPAELLAEPPEQRA